jgi:hypothetical protein
MNYDLSDYSADLLFSSGVYRASVPDFLPNITTVAREYIEKSKENFPYDKLYPVHMTEDISQDERIRPFIEYVANSAWQILDSQGYMMEMFFTHIQAAWVQDHKKYSSMDYHIHQNLPLVGFYFIEVPEDCDVFSLVHDPRSAKIYSSLPMRMQEDAHMAFNSIQYKPNAGDLYFTNGWLPHSFTRNRSDKSFNFMHFNINVIDNPNYQPSTCDAPVIV